jgi:hypothetical protein
MIPLKELEIGSVFRFGTNSFLKLQSRYSLYISKYALIPIDEESLVEYLGMGKVLTKSEMEKIIDRELDIILLEEDIK